MTSLWSITQGLSETLDKYTERFIVAYSCVTNPNEEFVIQADLAGVANENVQLTLCGNDMTDMEGLINKAHKLFDMQEMSQNRAPCTQQYDQKRVDLDRNSWPSHRNRSAYRSKASRQLVHRKFESYTPLIVDRAQILNAIANEPYLKRPHPLKHGLNIDRTKYCSFHRDYGYTTEECQKLKDEIEYYVRKD